MGTLGLSEREYYTNSPYVNFCKAEGYFDKEDTETERVRNLAYITHASMVGKGALSKGKLWPTRYDIQDSVTVVMTDELRDQIIKAHGLTI